MLNEMLGLSLSLSPQSDFSRFWIVVGFLPTPSSQSVAGSIEHRVECNNTELYMWIITYQHCDTCLYVHSLYRHANSYLTPIWAAVHYTLKLYQQYWWSGHIHSNTYSCTFSVFFFFNELFGGFCTQLSNICQSFNIIYLLSPVCIPSWFSIISTLHYCAVYLCFKITIEILNRMMSVKSPCPDPQDISTSYDNTAIDRCPLFTFFLPFQSTQQCSLPKQLKSFLSTWIPETVANYIFSAPYTHAPTSSPKKIHSVYLSVHLLCILPCSLNADSEHAKCSLQPWSPNL